MSNTSYSVTTRSLRRLLDAFKGEVDRVGDAHLLQEVYSGDLEKYITFAEFRDRASRSDLLNFFANYISDRGGSLRAAVPLELVLALLKVPQVNFEKLYKLCFIEMEIAALNFENSEDN